MRSVFSKPSLQNASQPLARIFIGNAWERYFTIWRKEKGVVIEGHLMGDHVHMCLSIPPKCSVSDVVGYLKGKSAIAIARNFKGRQRHFTGEAFWARGYFVLTVELDEKR
jgi:putative transposase